MSRMEGKVKKVNKAIMSFLLQVLWRLRELMCVASKQTRQG